MRTLLYYHFRANLSVLELEVAKNRSKDHHLSFIISFAYGKKQKTIFWTSHNKTKTYRHFTHLFKSCLQNQKTPLSAQFSPCLSVEANFLSANRQLLLLLLSCLLIKTCIFWRPIFYSKYHTDLLQVYIHSELQKKKKKCRKFFISGHKLQTRSVVTFKNSTIVHYQESFVWQPPWFPMPNQ